MDLHSRRAQPAQSPHRQPPDHPGTHRPASLTRPPAPNPPNSTAPAGDPATARPTTATVQRCCWLSLINSSVGPTLLLASVGGALRGGLARFLLIFSSGIDRRTRRR